MSIREISVHSPENAARASVLPWLLGVGVLAYEIAFPRVLGRADESVLLHGAKRLLEGQALYKDFFEFMTPASFYLFAVVFGITGPSLLVARLVMAGLNALSCVLLYMLARRVAAALEAVVAVVLFAATCLPVWPYASAHWLSTTLCLGTAALLLGNGWERPRRARTAVAGALAGLTFCVQQQRGVFLGLWIVMAIPLRACVAPAGDRWRRCRNDFIRAAIGWTAVSVPILGYSAWRSSVRQVVYAVFTWVFANYYTFNTGTVPWAGVCILCGGIVRYTWLRLLRGLPFVLLAEGLALAWVLRRKRGAVELRRACLFLLCGGMMLATLYYPDFIHVAFIAPFGLILAARLAHALRAGHLFQQGPVRKWIPRIALAAIAIAAVQKGWSNLQYSWHMAPERFESAVGTLHGDANYRALFEQVRQVMNHDPAGAKVLFSYPADPWLYLAVPAENPTPFSHLQPVYNTPEQFREALDAVEYRRTPYLVINVSFAASSDPVMLFQRERYDLVSRVGPYGIFARRPAAEPPAPSAGSH